MFRRGRAGWRLALASAGFPAAIGALAACVGGADRPTRLADETRTSPPPVVLEGVRSPQIATKAAVADPGRLVDRSVGACLAATREHAPRAPVISRTGVHGTSVTFGTASGRSLVGCDGIGSGSSWCGRALGRLRSGRLGDPRLDLVGCSTAHDEPVAFAWVEPGRGTRYVAVGQKCFTEVYPVLAGLPVRVATTAGIDLDTSSASFEISEHDRAGRALRSYTMEVGVAG